MTFSPTGTSGSMAAPCSAVALSSHQGANLRLDQVGLPAEIAWKLFGPLVARELGNSDDVRARTARAAEALDALMERSWVIINRAPTLTPTCLLAFHPVRLPDPVTRLHPLVCPLLNADFDGDTASVFLPITAAAQCEAGERLSVAAHLARDPGGARVAVADAGGAVGPC